MTIVPELDWADVEGDTGPAEDTCDLIAARRAWQPVDLGRVLDGTYQAPLPTVGARSDGVGLFYPRRVHSAAGESESGKTFVLLAQVEVELRRGNAAVFVDFEDDEGGVVGRLLALGAKPEAVRERFAYLRPDEPIGGLGHRGDLEQALGDLLPTLVVIDGVTEAMTMHGLDPLSNKDAATFGRLVPRYIAEHGPATVVLDHVTKSAEGRGRYAIGAVHKLNGLNGSALIVENRSPFGVGITGRSTVLVSKDRPGQVRRHGVPTSGGSTWLADFVLISHDESFVEASLNPPAATSTEDFRPTVIMHRVSEAMVKAGKPLTKSDIEARVFGKATTVRQGIAFLVDEGFVTTTKGPNNSTLHTLATPFGEEPTS